MFCCRNRESSYLRKMLATCGLVTNFVRAGSSLQSRKGDSLQDLYFRACIIVIDIDA